MHDTITAAYRITRDVTPRALSRRTATRRALERQGHTLALEATKDGVVGPFADWWYDLRRMRLTIYGALLRFIDTASTRVPKWMLKVIPGMLDSYIDDVYAEQERRR